MNTDATMPNRQVLYTPKLTLHAWSILCALLLLCTAATSPPARADAIEELYNDALAQVRRNLDDRVLDLHLRNVEQGVQKAQQTVEQMKPLGEGLAPELTSVALMRGVASAGRIADAKNATAERWNSSLEILMARLSQAANREMERMKPYASNTVDAAQWAAFMRARYKFESYKLLAGHLVRTLEIYRRYDDEFGIVRHALTSIPVDAETQANLEALGMSINRQMNGFVERELKFIGQMYDVVASVGGG